MGCYVVLLILLTCDQSLDFSDSGRTEVVLEKVAVIEGTRHGTLHLWSIPSNQVQIVLTLQLLMPPAFLLK